MNTVLFGLAVVVVAGQSRIWLSRWWVGLSVPVADIPASAASCMAAMAVFWLVKSTAHASSRCR